MSYGWSVAKILGSHERERWVVEVGAERETRGKAIGRKDELYVKAAKTSHFSESSSLLSNRLEPTNRGI